MAEPELIYAVDGGRSQWDWDLFCSAVCREVYPDKTAEEFTLEEFLQRTGIDLKIVPVECWHCGTLIGRPKPEPEDDGCRIVVTARVILDYGNWDNFCDLRGINPWAINEGLMDSNEEFNLTREELDKVGLTSYLLGPR